MILDYLGTRPTCEEGVWIAPDATVIGDVTIGAGASIWFQSVVRGDVAPIRIGPRTNVQDHCTIHVTRDGHPTIVGAEVTLGHRVVLHGCRVYDRALIGIGAIVLDDAVIEEGALVAAMSLVTPGMVVPAGKLVMGQPAKVVRDVSEEERRWMAETVSNYATYAANYARARRP
ncbi:MAG: gamma carbonic anhydrase family protein [Candidatus Dadabacteria bacterium]|nr:MAG: gamma carbonic anhydrase family protein [Candidatus Dadabacteria bacterium]